MTQNQINYAKLEEEKRHNLATEGYTGIELQETQRHNVRSEDINWYNAQEGARHNVASESLNWYTAANQSEVYKAQAANQYAQASLAGHTAYLQDSQAVRNAIEADVAQLRLDLDERRLKEEVLKDLRASARDEQRIEILKDQVQGELENLLLRYNLDVAQYYNSGYWKDVSQAVRNFTGAAKDVNAILDSLISSVQKFISSGVLSTQLVPTN